MSRIEWFTLGYILFRVTSDVERLPFPLAPVAAQGATALAEADEGRDSWRWRVFSVGMGIGLLFGAVYVGLPALTGLIASDPIVLLPIPWIDLTRNTQDILPAAPLGIGTDLGLVLLGMVLPFWIVVGTFVAAMVHALGQPNSLPCGHVDALAAGHGRDPDEFRQMTLDVWMSVYIGAGAAVGAIGLVQAVLSVRAARRQGRTPPVAGYTGLGRGDFPLWIAIVGYALSTLAMIWLCVLLLEDDEFPLVFLLLFGFVVTPVISYVNARMAGLTGQLVSFPLLREGAFILSGYKGIDIWFAPIPYSDHGRRAQLFREVELTGTRFSSILKAELLLLPLSLVCGFVFWSLVWQMEPIPSPTFQYAQTYWHLIALRQCLWYSATLGGETLFEQAIKGWWIAGSFVMAGGLFGVMSWLGLPISLVYGFVRGLAGLPHLLIPEMAGALLARYWLEPRFGAQQWRQYAPVLLAGYACGMGLVGMSAVAIALISKSVTQLHY